MTGVVLRCPNCGTTRATPGECEACHEAQVRYYCTNHKPGIWLEQPACGRCGARFGVAAPPRRAPPRSKSPGKPPPAPPPRRSPTPAAPPPRTSAGRPKRVEPLGSPWSLDPRTRPGGARTPGRDSGAAADPLARLRDILEVAARGRRSPWGVPRVPAPRPALPLLGCLFRLALLIFFLLLMATAGGFMLVGGGLLHLLDL